MNKELHDANKRNYVAEEELKTFIAELGDQIAKDNNYPGLYGMDAVYRYLIDKYHWLPHEVRLLTVDVLNMLLDGYDKKKRAGTF